MLNSKVLVSVDGTSFETFISKADFAGFDIEKFGTNNEWADGKHYAGIMKCLSEMHENGTASASIERKGSSYSVSVI